MRGGELTVAVQRRNMTASKLSFLQLDRLLQQVYANTRAFINRLPRNGFKIGYIFPAALWLRGVKYEYNNCDNCIFFLLSKKPRKYWTNDSGSETDFDGPENHVDLDGRFLPLIEAGPLYQSGWSRSRPFGLSTGTQGK